MWISNLNLYQFRNYQSLNIKFSKGINYIYGNNGAGKTSLVEAIGFMTLIKSIRTNDEKEVIRYDNDFSRIIADIENKSEIKKIKIVISKKGKYVEIDDCEIKKISSIVGNIKVISFLPKDSEMFKDSPSKRRKFIDSSLSIIDHHYLSDLSEYNRYLEEIRMLIRNNDYDKMTLKILLDKISEYAVRIIRVRKEFINKINQNNKKIISYFENNETQADVIYQCDVDEEDKDKYSQYIFKNITENNNYKNYQVRGIHLDDIKINLNDKDLATYASQGQNRLCVISLKLSLIKLINDEYKEMPIVILDDVLSELDNNHQLKLIKVLEKFEQVFITGNKKLELKNIKYYRISENRAEED